MISPGASLKALAASRRGEHRMHRHGATLALRGRLVSVGWNKNKTHPRSTDKYKVVHAEMDAIIKAGPRARGATLYVARVLKDGTLACSRPCPACMAMIIASGIKEVYYTNNGTWEKL